MAVGDAIRRIRKAKGMTLEQVALAAQTDTGNLSRLERGMQGYTEDGLQLVATALGVRVSDFFADHQQDQQTGEPHGKYVVGAVEAGTLRVMHFEAPASMGSGLPMPEHETIVDHIDLNHGWVRSNLPDITSPKNLSFITGYGDSMEGTFFNGDILLVDRGVHDVKVDAVYVYALDNELFIKRLQRLPGGNVKVISDNQNYESYVLTDRQRQDIQVLGRIRGSWNWHRL